MKIERHKVDTRGTQILLSLPKDIGYIIQERQIQNVEVRFDDGRYISAEQRRKAYATISFAHQRGAEIFRKMYKVYGIKFNEDM